MRGCVIKSVLYSFKARITRITRIFFREMIIALLILALQIRVIRALSISKEAYDTPSFLSVHMPFYCIKKSFISIL